MRRARLLILLTLCAVWPATARAQSDIIDWLQPGSGPGPFTAKFTGYEVRVWCLPTGPGVMDSATRQVWNCLLDDPDSTRVVVSFGQVWSSTANARLFIDDPADVRVVNEQRVTAAITYRANSLLEVGGAIDAIQFSSDQGNAFSFWKFGIGPRLVFTPFGGLKSTDPRWGSANRTLHLRIDTTWLPSGLKASDFNNAVSRYDPGPEFMVRAGIELDGAIILRAIHP